MFSHNSFKHVGTGFSLLVGPLTGWPDTMSWQDHNHCVCVCVCVCLCVYRDSRAPQSQVSLTSVDLCWGCSEVGPREAWHFSLQHLNQHIASSLCVCVRVCVLARARVSVSVCVCGSSIATSLYFCLWVMGIMQVIRPTMLQCADSRDSFIYIYDSTSWQDDKCTWYCGFNSANSC